LTASSPWRPGGRRAVSTTPNALRWRSPRPSPASAISDQSDPVPDEIWDDAARHYDEPALAALILSIATTNVFNRLNVTTRQVAGSWT
jgi:hypothetical protein